MGARTRDSRLIQSSPTFIDKNLVVESSQSPMVFSYDDADRDRAATVLRQAFIAAQLGIPSEDPETAVDTLWIILEALLVDHLDAEAVTGPQPVRRTAVGEHWRRMVITAVTNTFVLSGDFVQPEPLALVIEKNAKLLIDGELWHTRRPPSQGALVLGVHSALGVLDTTARSGRFPATEDVMALNNLIALATLGSVMAGESAPNEERDQAAPVDDAKGRWARTPQSVASSFGIPDAELVAVSKSGWACAECGCVFLGRVEAGTAYPDRFSPVGRNGPCEVDVDCTCHAAPLQRRVR